MDTQDGQDLIDYCQRRGILFILSIHVKDKMGAHRNLILTYY